MMDIANAAFAGIPKQRRQHNGLCPQCGKPVTVGVIHRVETLADRPEGENPAPLSIISKPDPAAGRCWLKYMAWALIPSG